MSRLIGTGVIFLLAAFPGMADSIDWVLLEQGCSGGLSTLEVPCGEYGVFHFESLVQPPGCAPLTSGAENPPSYPPPGHMQVFPFQPRGIFDLVLVQQQQAAVSGSGGSSGLSAAHSSFGPSRPRLRSASSLNLPGGGSTQSSWIDVLDFSGAHGDSTSWLVGETAGPGVDVVLSELDDPALSALGQAVGDFHVLAKLCEVAELVDTGLLDPPRAINMSFGRPLQIGEVQTPESCDHKNANCQIARVLDHLHRRGSVLVAAAGNHRELLFPGSLSNVLAAGMLDLNLYFESGQSKPAWETPAEARALIPGSSLCLRSWAAPSGASYSSAIMTGWLSGVLDRQPSIDALRGGVWAPRWDATLGCHVLSRGRTAFPWCNEPVNALFEGLAGANSEICWNVATAPGAELPEPGPETSPPASPSFAAWSAETQPTPESDPCVPCEDLTVGYSPDVDLDLSQSPPLALGIHVNAVSLRVGSKFYPLSLTTMQLQQIRDGELARLTLLGASVLLLQGQQPSLWFQLKNSPSEDCAVPADCFWTSSPILLATTPEF